jgi:hypothetical protein
VSRQGQGSAKWNPVVPGPWRRWLSRLHAKHPSPAAKGSVPALAPSRDAARTVRERSLRSSNPVTTIQFDCHGAPMESKAFTAHVPLPGWSCRAGGSRRFPCPPGAAQRAHEARIAWTGSLPAVHGLTVGRAGASTGTRKRGCRAVSGGKWPRQDSACGARSPHGSWIFRIFRNQSCKPRPSGIVSDFQEPLLSSRRQTASSLELRNDH